MGLPLNLNKNDRFPPEGSIGDFSPHLSFSPSKTIRVSFCTGFVHRVLFVHHEPIVVDRVARKTNNDLTPPGLGGCFPATFPRLLSNLQRADFLTLSFAQSGFRTMEEPQTSAASTLSSNCIVLLLEEKIGGPLQNWGLDTT